MNWLVFSKQYCTWFLSYYSTLYSGSWWTWPWSIF